MLSTASQEHPLLKASEIEGLMKPSGHRLNPKCKKEQAVLSDALGMTGLGVHLIRVPAGAESTTLHYHLNVAEWMYIISGSGTLQLLDAGGAVFPITAKMEEVETGSAALQITDSFNIEEKPLGVGDFIGFRAGVDAFKYGHNIVAGPDGITYLCGGTRADPDICVYPQTNTALAISLGEKKLALLSRGDAV